jgi:hypothetical protein
VSCSFYSVLPKLRFEGELGIHGFTHAALAGAIAFLANQTIGLILLGLSLVLLVASFFPQQSEPVESREKLELRRTDP